MRIQIFSFQFHDSAEQSWKKIVSKVFTIIKNRWLVNLYIRALVSRPFEIVVHEKFQTIVLIRISLFLNIPLVRCNKLSGRSFSEYVSLRNNQNQDRQRAVTICLYFANCNGNKKWYCAVCWGFESRLFFCLFWWVCCCNISLVLYYSDEFFSVATTIVKHANCKQ